MGRPSSHRHYASAAIEVRWAKDLDEALIVLKRHGRGSKGGKRRPVPAKPVSLPKLKFMED